MNLRAFKAIFLKAFGRNGNGGAKASTATFLMSVVFVLAFVMTIANVLTSYWINMRSSREGYKRVVVINAPESFNSYIYSEHPEIVDSLRRYDADAAYNYSKYESLMRRNEAFMTIFFPENFEKTVKKGETAQILTYILNDKLRYTTWQGNFMDNVMKGYQNYLKIEADVTVTTEEMYTIKEEPVNTNGKGMIEYTVGYFGKTVIPLVTFVVMLYIGMSKGTNAVAGQKEKGTLTAVLLTPVRVRTIVTGNLMGITLATILPALICYPLICLIPYFFSITGILYGLMLIITLGLLIASVTLMISVMNDTVVAAQTAFLPVFFLLLGVCIMCMQGADDIARFYYWIPVYGHFYGIGQSLVNEDIQLIDVLICTGSTILLSVICMIISGILMKTERFSTTVESYSDKQAAKYLRSRAKQIERTSRPPKSIIFGYTPGEYQTSPKIIKHHIRFPLIVLSVAQTFAIIPAAIIISRTTFFHDIIDTARNLREPGEVITSVFDLFALFMAHPAFIFFMGLAYYGLIAVYFIKVRFFEKKSFATLGMPKTIGKGVSDYLQGMLLGLIMLSSVVLLLVVSGTAKITSFGIPEGSRLLFFVYILMWIPQGFSEELMFRGYMMPRLAPRFGKAFAVFFSSLLFGIFHAANRGFTMLALLNLILIAAAYALICLYKDNIIMTSAAHSVWNFAQGNLFGLEVSGNSSAASLLHSTYLKGVHPILSGGEFGPEGSIFVTVVSLITIGIVVFLLKRKASKTGSI